MMTIDESEMKFGPFQDDHVFQIEQSKTYADIQQGVQIAEFILLRSPELDIPMLWIVEAKSSSPQPLTQPAFDNYIREIRDKLANAYSLGLASILKRHDPIGSTELPEPFKALNLSTVQVLFILVVNGHKIEWLDPLKLALNKALHSVIKTWALGPNPVLVLNDEMARSEGLIV